MSGKARPRGSLRLNLMAWLVLPVAAILAASVWLSYGSALREATLVTDRQLLASARIIAEAIVYADGRIAAVIPPSALELFASDSHDEIAYAVFGPSNELIAGYPGLTGPAAPAADFDFHYFATMFRDEAMRATALRQPVITPNGTVSVSVMIGETLKARDELVQSLWIRGFLEQALLVLAASVSIWIGINRQLRPLLDLRRAVLDRPADRFEPFDAAAVQSEVRPLVVALNSHMERLRRQLERQRRFLDSAAHQLRTPLAIMKTQIGYARRSPEAGEVGAALEGVDGNLTAMARLTNQLLTLGRVEHDRDVPQAEIINLGDLVREAVAQAAPRALDGGLELAFESGDPVQIAASKELVREMLSNLIGNVIEHAGTGAVATISVRRVSGEAEIRVEDNGKGVEAGELAGLVERFRRGRNARAGGSGLGLSIVAEIAEMFDGSIELRRPESGAGFTAIVRLPVAEDSQLAVPAQNSR